MSATTANPLRIRPAVFILLVMWAAVLLPTRLMTFGAPMMIWMLVGIGGSMLALLTWWLLLSRVPWRDRLLGLLLLVGLISLGMGYAFHPSARMGMSIPTVLLPGVLTAATVGLLLSKPLPWKTARWVGAAWMLMAVTVWSGVRVDGADGALDLQLSWRGMPTAEEEFLAQRGDDLSGVVLSDSATPVTLSKGDWPSFRGPHQDAVYRGPSFPTKWELRPPKQLWRRRVGPGWSSFAVVGDRVYTQEQRGDLEAVVCYNGNNGEESWAATTTARLYTVESGAGPLSTPSFYEGALYTTGGEGAVQRLDAATGKLVWRRQLVDDLPVSSPPAWGFASSVLVVPHGESALAIVYAGNPKPDGESAQEQDHGVIAYHSQTGEPAWTAGVGYHAYCTPKLVELGGVSQVLVASNVGLESLDPATGERLWFYDWSMGEFPRIAQPIVVDDQTLVLAAGYGFGAHGVRVTRSDGQWATETLWQTRQLRPYFNDCLFHEGHIYGFDDKFLTCLDARTGKLAWPKRTRRQSQFGCGQVLLAERTGVLMVMTELTGELVLLEATPDAPREVTRLKVLEGKTWNHPVIAHDRIYVRNGVEAACYELPSLDVALRPQHSRDGL